MIFYLIFIATTFAKGALWMRWAPETHARFSRRPEGLEWWTAIALGHAPWVLPPVMMIFGIWPDWSTAQRLSGVPIFLSGSAIFLTAAVVNPWFSPEIVLPKEYCNRWIYRILRHPGYVGILLQQGGLAAMMGYTAGLWLYGAYAALILSRVIREERLVRRMRPAKQAVQEERSSRKY